MLTNGELILFVIASLVLLVAPGPAIFYIVARSVQQGSKAGVVSAAGVVTGGFIHVVAGTIGLSALLLSSAIAFSVVKYLGALYLVLLGLRTLFGKESRDAPEMYFESRMLWRIYRDGIIVNLLNPKVILFFVAFLPQFVEPSRGNPSLQFLFLGVILVTMGFVTDSVYALTADIVSRWFRRNTGRFPMHRWLAGSVYLVLGAFTALFEPAR